MLSFIVDSMLGKLAKRLRLLGFDTAYYADAEDSFLLRRSREEERILLTHDLALTRVRGANAYFVVSRKLSGQIREVAGHFKLELELDPALFLPAAPSAMNGCGRSQKKR